MNFAFFHVESIHGFTSTFADILSSTSWTFGFPSGSKCPLLDIIKCLVTTLSNYNKKDAFIRFDEYVSLARYYMS